MIIKNKNHKNELYKLKLYKKNLHINLIIRAHLTSLPFMVIFQKRKNNVSYLLWWNHTRQLPGPSPLNLILIISFKPRSIN